MGETAPGVGAARATSGGFREGDSFISAFQGESSQGEILSLESPVSVFGLVLPISSQRDGLVCSTVLRCVQSKQS